MALKISVLCNQLPDFAIPVVNVYDCGDGAIDDPYGVKVESMSGNALLPDVSEGVAEPAASRVIIAIFAVGLIGLLGMFSTIFGWDSLPVFNDIAPMLDSLGGSGIWYYLIGIMVMIGMIVANMIGEIISD